MVCVNSLGLHTPVGLPFLISEQILPEHASENLYDWQITSFHTKEGLIEEELVVTQKCVAWSRNGILRRLFRFDIEGEPVSQALFTQFSKAETKPASKDPENKHPSHHSGVASIVHVKEEGEEEEISDQSRALVVLLSTQAHIFFIAGTTHVIHLPFEVDCAFPAPLGFILQRKSAERPAATSSQDGTLSSTFSSQRTPTAFRTPFPSKAFQKQQHSETDLLGNIYDLTNRGHPNAPSHLPCVFTVTDPLLELGLVVSTAPSSNQNNRSKKPSRKSFAAIGVNEKVVYVTASSTQLSDRRGPMLVLTTNNETGKYTVYSAQYIKSDTASNQMKHKVNDGSRLKRKSSFGPATNVGSTAPNTRKSQVGTESFAVPNRAASQSVKVPPPESDDTSLVDPLMSTFDMEFERRGPSTRDSRRVSSLLARTDLSTGHDKQTFSDLATGTIPLGASQSFRRGDSLGSQNLRTSFGAGFANSQRKSHQGLGGTLSARSSSGFYDPPVDELLDELNAGGDFEGFENMGLQEVVEGLKREIVLTPLVSVPAERDFNFSHSSKSLKVFVLTEPHGDKMTDESKPYQITMCVVDRNARKLIVFTFSVYNNDDTQIDANKLDDSSLHIEYTDQKTGSGVLDATKVEEGSSSRILVLTETDDGYGELTLQAPWSPLVKVILPQTMTVWNSYSIGFSNLDTSEERRLKRVLSSSPKSIVALGSEASLSKDGRIVVVDEKRRQHWLKIQLTPNDPHVRAILEMCRALLPSRDRAGEGLLVCWWEVKSWVRARAEPSTAQADEWTVLVVMLFCLFVPVLSQQKPLTKARPRKTKRPFLRSSSGASTDWTDWNAMLEMETDQGGGPLPQWMDSSCWSWMNAQHEVEGPLALIDEAPCQKTDYLIDCIDLARAFIDSPKGAIAAGPEGYLPTSASQSHILRQNVLPTLLISLHLFREEQKLDSMSSSAGPLLPLLAQIGTWLDWKNWGFGHESMFISEDVRLTQWSYDDSKLEGLEMERQPFAPPFILDWACQSLSSAVKTDRFLTLDQLIQSDRWNGSELLAKPKRSSTVLCSKFTPRTHQILKLLSSFTLSVDSYTKIIETLSKAGMTQEVLNTLPYGITASFQESIYRVQPNPPTTWNSKLLQLVDRDDLNLHTARQQKGFEALAPQLGPTHEGVKDCHIICTHTTDTEAIDAFDGSQESNRRSITRLIFKEDRRFAEASKLLASIKPTMIRCEAEPDWSEADFLEAQKELVQIVAIRTLAIPSGRGLLLFNARVPHRTEKYPLFGFNLTCIMRPSGNTVSADKSAFTEEKVCWAFFHAGVTAGLSISRAAKGIDTSWILYNKPNELSNRHAGFLLALGLNGHLKSIAKWVAFKYLTPKHIMTSIGLLLGLSASYLGTMDSLVTRLLSVHVTRMLPPGAAELNLSPLTQTAGIMGIGLLYCGTQHRRMSEIMLSEIEHVDVDDPSGPVDQLRDEGYRLAAGFALGFINLGRGRDLKGLRDMHIVERLLGLAVGSRKVHLVHVLDRSTAAATIAIALIYMKSNDEVLANKIDIPDSALQFDYVRPDIFLLRTLAKHLIMWDSIVPSVDWIKESLPKASPYAINASLRHIHRLSSANMPLYNIIAGLCFAVGIRFAGSKDENARGLLIHYLDQFIRLCKQPALTYDQRLTKSTIRNCQDVLALSAATVMAGSGDLFVFRRLRSLHGREDPETPFGSHLATHIAIGALFLGGGSCTFGTSDIAAAALICAFYPLFPNDILDNKSHLQAFRHFWVLAVEQRCLVAQDAFTNRPVSVPIEIKLKDGREILQTVPCLLPDTSDIATITTKSLEYWQVVLDFENNQTHLDSFKANQTISLRRRVTHETGQSAFQANFLSLSRNETEQHPLTWLFGLDSLKGIARSERGLIIPPDSSSMGHISMDTTMIDTRLVLSKYLSSGNRDRLWTIRMILEWAERMDKKGETLQWLGQGEIDRLRAEAWMTGDSYSQDA